MADAAVVERDTQINFTRSTVDAAGTPVEVAHAGNGLAVVHVAASSDRLAQLLAGQFRICCFEPGEEFAALAPAMKARRIAAIADALGLEQYCLSVEGDDAIAALHLAADEPEKLQRAVLLAPEVFDSTGVLNDPSLAAKLERITGHSLSLFGTDSGGNVQVMTSLYREKIPNCHLMYVFDALDPARSRPEAAAEVIADFLLRGDGFLVSEQDGRLFP
jgi:pimeloyl-ACP methyl ester carboxylesterase